MKTKFLLISFLFLISLTIGLSSCDKCNDIDCFTPPVSLEIQIIDETSKRDWFVTNSVNPDLVKIYSEGEMRYHQLNYVMVDSVFRIFDNEIGWENGGLKTNYRIEIDSISIPFQYETRIVNEDCCSFYETITVDFGIYLDAKDPSENFFRLKL